MSPGARIRPRARATPRRRPTLIVEDLLAQTIASLVIAAIVIACGSIARAAEPPAAAPGTRFVYLIRHGIYDRDTLADDRTGNGLNALGHEQARLVGVRLKALPVTYAALVSSDFTRARETADDMGAVLGMKATRDSLIHECSPRSNRPDIMRGTTPEEVALSESNLAAAWARYMTPAPAGDAHVLLVSHGNVIRWLVCRGLGVETGQWASMDLANASLTILAVRPDGTTRLVMFSDVGHLPVEKQTWSGRGAGWARPPQAPKAR
jgi:broad specificity phosphatase PhoE